MTEQIKKYTVCTKDDIEPVTIIETNEFQTIEGFIKLEAIKESRSVLLKIQRGKGKYILGFESLKFKLDEFEKFVELANKFLKTLKEND